MAESETGLRRPATFVRPIALVGLIALALIGWFTLRGVDGGLPGATPAASLLAASPPAAAPSVVVPTSRTAKPATPPAAAFAAVPAGPAGPPTVLPNTAPEVAPAAPPGQAGIVPEGSKPRFDIVRVSPQGAAVLAGQAEPGSQVQVADNGHQIGSAQADGRGQWVITPAAPLPGGGRELTLKAIAPDGKAAVGDAPVMVLRPEPSSSGPVGPATAGAAASAALPQAPAVAILLPMNAPARLLQAVQEPDAPFAKAPNLDVVDYDDQGRIRFAGTAPAGSAIRAYIDDLPVGDAVADARGHWGLVPNTAVAIGDHQLRIDQLSAAGRPVARAEFPFQRAEVSANAVSGDRIVVQPRQNLWRLARRAYGRGIQYTVIYLANRSQIRDPNLIYPGQLFAIPAQSP